MPDRLVRNGVEARNTGPGRPEENSDIHNEIEDISHLEGLMCPDVAKIHPKSLSVTKSSRRIDMKVIALKNNNDPDDITCII